MASENIKVAVFATHPVQYHIPWFQALSAVETMDTTVYYAAIPDEQQQGVGFGVSFKWDIPMFDGYHWEQLPNHLAQPGIAGFFDSKIRGILSILRQKRPDVIILTGWQQWPLLQVYMAARYLGIPLIIRGESNAMRHRSTKAKMFHRLFLPGFRAYLAIGKSSRAFYRGYGIEDARIFQANYFVDNQRFVAESEKLVPQRAALRHSMGVTDSDYCFLYSGKLNEKKRILDLLAALRIAGEENSNLRLLVVGTGELMEEAQSMVSRSNLPVTFVGFLNQSEISKAYVASDCIVLPSDYGETWGLVVNEAMACGRPAIVSDRVGCGPDLVENGETGLQFPFGDVRALAQCMLAMAQDPQASNAMGLSARGRVLNDYSVKQAVQSTCRAIEMVVRQ